MGISRRSLRWRSSVYVFVTLIIGSCAAILFTMFGVSWTPGTTNDQLKELGTTSSEQSVVSTSKSVTPEPMMSSAEPVTILLWTWPGGHTFPLNQCPSSVDSSGCLFTVNRSMYSMANAVVFHHRDVSMSILQLPTKPRPSNQYWIWFNMEPPPHLRNLTLMDNIMNLTMSYRTDSDIFTPYGWLEKNSKAKNFTLPQKTGLVAWVVSNWRPKHNRVKYYNQLKNFIHIDVYGKNHTSLPRNKHCITLSKYKFYLAFENFLHEDYITEKLWSNSLNVGSVPVVMGPPRKNYERFIPRDSFIHVDDFSSPQELASHLLRLDKDEQRYLQYFHWRSKYQPAKPRPTWVTEYCKVCQALKVAPPYRTIPSIADWFK